MAHESPGARPVQLHVIHDLGGGSAKWLVDFCDADTARTNLVLRPFAHDAAMGAGVALFADPAAEVPLKVWKFAERIEATVPHHAGYAAALREVIEAHGVQGLIVSSLIGHSLEALETGLPTLVVCHDYFPWCPAINLHYGQVCGKCDGARVAECHQDNPDYNPFSGFEPPARIAARERYVELVRRPSVRVVVPSASVAGNLQRLEPRFAQLHFDVVPHGYGKPLPHVDLGALSSEERLRVLVPGQLSLAKGLRLLRGAIPELTRFADVYFLGCREAGEYFRFHDHVHVTSDYQLDELPGHVRAIRPHVAVCASVVAETFGYALSEAMMLGVPPAVTRVGAFAERVRDGETGFLFEPDVSSLLARMKALDSDRGALARVRENLEHFRHRSAGEMVADYHRLLPMAGRAAGAAPASRPLEASEAVEAMTLASMWKQLRTTHVQLNVAVDARHRSEQARASERRAFEEQIRAMRGELHDARSLLAEKGMRLQEKERQLQDEEAKLNEVMGSTSWRLTRPVRWLGTTVPAIRKAWRRLRYGAAAVALQRDADETPSATWRRYRETLERDVRPRLAESVERLPRRPLLTVIVPTYNTPEALLRQTLDSVRGQIYPEWELCVADDGSTAAHVRAVLDEYAAADPRIRVDYAQANGGVSRASNRALGLARGEYVVLLDHDDVLEEQALFRVAESILADDPDMLYSDEVLVGPDAQEVQRYILRPAFSPEHLRSHPYIVHLVAFRASLLREVGGWNEALRISQDYDLIVRVAERARKIVHIPEILYRWRNLGASAGHARQGQVMEASMGLLRRHLERTGVPGRVEEGASFNFFSVRYALAEGQRVGIVIPTKNHGELLRQCIDSVRATIGKVAYDIVVVDHESDDPATLDYLASLAGQAKVLRYSGPFNFAAINNWAVKQLGEGYSHYLLCNNDIEAYEHGWLERMVELGQQPDAGIVGAMLFYPDRKTIQHAGVCIGMSRGAEHYGKFLRYPEDTSGLSRELLSMTREVAAVTAACMLVRKDAWDEVGGFDEKIAVGYGDVDLCLRVVDSGRRVLFCASARLIHHESFTRGTSEFDPHPVDTSAFREKWKRLLEAGDPYYSPAFSLNSRRWEIRRPLPCQVEVRRRVVERDPGRGRNRIAFSPSI